MSFDSFVESWTPYDPTSVTTIATTMKARWTNPNIAAGGAIIDPTGGRRGGPSFSLAFGSSPYKTLSHSSDWVFGVAIKTDTLINAGGGIVALLNNNVRLFQLNINPDGTVSTTGSTQAQIINTTALPYVFSNRWIHLQCVVGYSGTTNITTTASLYINGVLIASGSVATGVNKANLLSNSAETNVIQLGSGMVAAGGTTFDGSIYIHNTQGDIPGVWGDGRIYKVLPNGDTAQKDWTPNSGTVHYNRVNELPKDDDTTYLYISATGQKDSWDWEDLPSFTGVIRVVQVSMAGRKDDEGSKAFRIGVGATLTEAQSGDYYVNDDYIYYHFPWDLDPATGLAWTRANFNAKQFGIESRV